MKSTYDALTNLRKLRAEKNWTKIQVSEKLGYTPAVYGHIERGRTELKLSVLVALADLYEVSLDDLIGRHPLHSSGAPARSSMAQINLFD